MKRKVRFYQSVNFKIALAFILILLISMEIIRAYFIRGLDRSTMEHSKICLETKAETLASTLGNHLEKNDDEEQENIELQRILDNSDSPDTIEMKVVDEKNIVRGTTNIANRNMVGKKN